MSDDILEFMNEQSNELEIKIENSSEDNLEENFDFFPNLIGDDYPKDYLAIINRFKKVYESLPMINYNAIYKELSLLSIKSKPAQTLNNINLQLQTVQSMKDRLSEIFVDVSRCYSFKKRAVNILNDAWGKFAVGSSADKRKSDSTFRLSDFHRDLAEIEALNCTCEHVLRNLDSINNNLSRQITLIQSQLKLMDLGRGALPDMNFLKKTDDSFGMEDVDENKNNEGGNEQEVDIEAEECEF